MRSQDDAGSPAGGAAATPEPEHRPSRRSVLRGGGAAGAGIAAVALAGPAGPARAAAARPAARTGRGSGAGGEREAGPAEPIVAHVRDARTGEIDLFRGTSQVRLHDPELAARLIRASR